FTPLIPMWASALARPWHDPGSCPTLILLAGSEVGDGVLGYSSYWRSVYAVRAERASRYRQILISGGPAGSETATAQSMADFLIASGVPRTIIRLETKSRSTQENAEFSARLLQGEPGCKILMTSDYHMARARGAFEKVGL